MVNVPVNLEHELHRCVLIGVILCLYGVAIAMILWMYPIVMVIIHLLSRQQSLVM